MSKVNSPCYLLTTLIGGDGAQRRSRVEVEEAETQQAASVEFIHQQLLALLEHI